jgi:hypothetical protein
MTRKAHPLEAAFDWLPPKKASADEIRIPWSAEQGLFIADLFAGAKPLELPGPASGALPPVRYTYTPHGALFLAQRWSKASVVRWEEAGTVGIDRAAVCLFPRVLVGKNEDTDPLEAALSAADSMSFQGRLAGADVVALRTFDDGSPELFRAIDAAGVTTGWVLNLGYVELPWQPPELPTALQPFIKPQVRVAVAGRRARSIPFAQHVAELKLPRRILGTTGIRDAFALTDISVLEVEPNDHHFYDAELARVGVPNPAAVYRAVYEPRSRTSAPDPQWRTTLAVLARVARDTQGVLYQVEREQPLMHDFKDA